MVRFDFLVDRNLKPWMVEANMSPNLFPKNSADGNMKHFLIKSIMRLVGLDPEGELNIHRLIGSSWSLILPFLPFLGMKNQKTKTNFSENESIGLTNPSHSTSISSAQHES